LLADGIGNARECAVSIQSICVTIIRDITLLLFAGNFIDSSTVEIFKCI
jgi:hypothetical protein